jgi:hypothetical protein
MRGQCLLDLLPRQRAGDLLGAGDQRLDGGVGLAGGHFLDERRRRVARAERLGRALRGLGIELVEGGHGERMPARPGRRRRPGG